MPPKIYLRLFRRPKSPEWAWVYRSAGPIAAATEGQVEKNREAFRHVAKVLREAGINVVSPLEINPPCLGRDRHTCLRNDIAALTQCDEIALLDNWAGSSGVKVEMQVAEAIGLRIWPNWRNLLGPNWRNLLDEGA